MTCGQLPALDDDDRLLTTTLAARDLTVVPAVWDDPAVDWTRFDLTVIRSTWDYPPRRDEFVRWARSVPDLVNPADVVAWNTDKRYLVELAHAGLPVVPTSWLAPSTSPWRPDAAGEWVVKPAVGAGSRDAGRYQLADAAQYGLAVAHVGRLWATDRVAMAQPYLPTVEDHGETAMVFLGGRFSHAVRKGPLLTGPDVASDELYKQEDISPRVPSGAELALADRILAAVPGGPGRLLYARVDLVHGLDGAPLLMELELTEPSLYLQHCPGAVDSFAAAIAAAIHGRG